MRVLGKLSVQIVTICIVTLAGFELCGLAIGNNLYHWPARQLFTTTRAIRPIGDDGLWTYAPDRTTLLAATYRLSAIEGWVEYDCSITTNRFGLTDTNIDPDHAAVDYLVLGNSFLEGQGGCPWLTRAALPKGSPLVINGGLFGASLQTMDWLEQWLSAQIQVRNLVLVLIGNDFKRMPIAHAWRAREACIDDGQCDPNLDFLWAVEPGTRGARLLELSRQILDGQKVALAEQGRRTLTYHSFTGAIYRRYAATFGAPPPGAFDPEQAFALNVAAFDRLHARYPGLKVVLVPQRDEVGLLGWKNADTKRIEAHFHDHKVVFRSCALELSDYMPIDGHPNRAGYGKLLACLQPLLDTPAAPPVNAESKPSPA